MATVNPIPEGFHTVTPHLVVNHAADAIEFCQQAFDAEELSRMPGPKGRLLHAEIRIGDSRVMLVDEFPEHGKRGPRPSGGSPVAIHLYVEDADATFARALAAGAKVVTPLQDSFWGDRYGRIEDPFGHHWSIATRKENLTREEILMRAPTMEV